jgi:hypothetical protein
MVRIELIKGKMTVNEQEYEHIKHVLFPSGEARYAASGCLYVHLTAKDVHDILTKPAFRN